MPERSLALAPVCNRIMRDSITSSVTYVRPTANGYVASLAAWGQNRDEQTFNSFVAESTWRTGKQWIWGRFETVDKPRSLLTIEDDEERLGRVQAYTAGYEHELPRFASWLSTGLGGQFTVYQPPALLRAQDGSRPVGAQFFLRMRLATR